MPTAPVVSATGRHREAALFLSLLLLSAIYLGLRPPMTGGLFSLMPNGGVPSNALMPHESPPVRISIPNIGVNASIESVGLTEQGAMDVPSDRANAGWFRHGPFPGNAGSAVIAGHYGWKDGKASAFDNLSDLSVGDRIFVEDADGNRTAFVVKRTSRYTPDANTEEVFLSDDGKSYLNLITCDGAWNSAQESYANRLVVFSEREEAVATTVVKKSGK